MRDAALPDAGQSPATPVKRLSKADRQARILAELRASTAIRISHLAQELGVSTETIRRDLDRLDSSGLVNRTYGGAAALPFGLEPTVSERHNIMVAERGRIAALAAGLVSAGEVLMIDAGSTTAHLARRLGVESRDLTVITNCLAVATALSVNPTIAVILCPGRYDAREGSVHGADAVEFIRRFNANRAIIGASGITVDGPNEVYPGAAAVKRAMLERARASMLLIDHEKFGRPALEVICPLSAIDELIADAAPTGALAGALGRAGTAVRIAGNGADTAA